MLSAAFSRYPSVETKGASSEYRRNLEKTQAHTLSNILQCQDENGSYIMPMPVSVMIVSVMMTMATMQLSLDVTIDKEKY